MVKQVNHNALKMLVKHYYKTKLPLFVWGRFGIGKSKVIKDSSMEIAKEKKREFKDWNRLSDDEREEVFKNPHKYFVLIDIRLSEYDSSDIKGLPNFKDDKKSIEFKVPYWALLLEKENSDGLLFFDEINLSTPLVISSCYKIIYDRVINQGRINDNWLIIGAGNTAEDRAYTHDIAPPLRDRGGEVELLGAGIDSWSDWAIKNNIDSRIIGFLNFKSSNLWRVDYDDKQKFTTHRGWERVSHLIKGIDDYDDLELISSSAISEGIAGEFIAFCKIEEKLKIDEIIKNPKRIKDITEISTKYFLVTAIADKYKDDKIKFDKVLEISKVLDEANNSEFVALLWRICYGLKTEFKTDFIEKVDDKMVEKYSKYLI